MDTLDCIIIVVVVVVVVVVGCVCVCVCVVRFVSKQIIRFMLKFVCEMKNLVFSCQKKHCRQTKNAHKKKSLTALHIF